MEAYHIWIIVGLLLITAEIILWNLSFRDGLAISQV